MNLLNDFFRRYRSDLVARLLLETSAVGFVIMFGFTVFSSRPAVASTSSPSLPPASYQPQPAPLPASSPPAVSSLDFPDATVLGPEKPTVIAPSRQDLRQFEVTPTATPVDFLDRPVDRQRIKPSANTTD